ncbi:MAG: DoxX family protein [Bacteroidetes bacterium]|nr:MAG: DoxX family protein [Bacteroidota bacterium]TAG92193.1 MAG: DoxX family protein [Bacteroidota bacterium]
MKIFIWFLKIMASVIMLQTLFFKFSGAEESVFIFSTLGIEPYGRIGVGILELVASVLLIIPKTTFLGAFLGIGLMAGAILSHILFLGINVKNDNGELFILALIVFLSCLCLAIIHKTQLFQYLKKLKYLK